MAIWIDDNASLAAFCRQLQNCDLLAVDTEFMWSTTYYAKLALIQVSAGTAELNALIDPLAITDPEPIRQLLENEKICKVTHEAASDLPILRSWCQALPQNIFDTRIAGAFCGLGGGCSLNKLLTEVLQITLEKGETRSDWLLRPLSENQLRYAVEDVQHLPELARQLQQRISACGNWAYFGEEMQIFGRTEFYRLLPPDECWTKINGAGRLNRRQLAVLQQLAAWREETARRRNRSRPRLIKDAQLLEVAGLLPKSSEELHRITEFRQEQIKKYGEDIIMAVQQGLAVPTDRCPQLPDMPMAVKEYHSRIERVQSLVRKRCQSNGIDPGFLTSRREIGAFVLAAERPGWPFSSSLLQGWRARVLGETIFELARGGFSSLPV